MFHLAAAGVHESCGGQFHVYTLNHVDATQLLAACMGKPIEGPVCASSSSVYDDCVPLPMRSRGAVYNIGGGPRVALLAVLELIRISGPRCAWSARMTAAHD